MSTLSDRLEHDLHVAIKARDELTTATLRLALTAIRNAEVSGKQARELSDDDVVAVLSKEAKKRRESADTYAAAGRTELAEREVAEQRVLTSYLPAQLSDEELAALVSETLAEHGVGPGSAAMGQAMKAVNPKVAGRADGKRVAAEVRRQLG